MDNDWFRVVRMDIDFYSSPLTAGPVDCPVMYSHPVFHGTSRESHQRFANPCCPVRCPVSFNARDCTRDKNLDFALGLLIFFGYTKESFMCTDSYIDWYIITPQKQSISLI